MVMTKNEAFKKRIRARMEKTGERYNAARRALIGPDAAASWVSMPEVPDDNVAAATGKSWNTWRTILDDWGAAKVDHPAIAKHLAEQHGLDGWWSQAVTIGYERITGRRLPNQMSDGTFTAIKNRTMDGSATELRALLDDDQARQDLFGGRPAEALSRAGVKTPRFAVGPGIAKISIVDKGDNRMTVGVQHTKLPAAGDVEEWKFFWTEWLDAIESA